MAEVHPLSDQRRAIIADGDRSALRATWHTEAGYVVISLWRGDSCVATSRLTPREAGRLATFITSGLAALAERPQPSQVVSISAMANTTARLNRGIRTWRNSVGRSLEKIARRLHSTS